MCIQHVYFARSHATGYSAFLNHLVDDLTGTGAEISPDDPRFRGSMRIRRGSEYGILRVIRSGPDIQIIYSPDERNSPARKTPLAMLIEENVTDIDDEMKALSDGQVQEPQSEDLIRITLSDIHLELLSVQEEIEHLRSRGKDVSTPERRALRAETLYHEAKSDLGDGHVQAAMAKTIAIQVMVEKAEAGLSEIEE
ncbi:hypothetical protein [Methanofollis fontis]|uniref:Uncharacterized protein n=1 Tax=Methanofollis fontis TaxID=2052832 RepID=A0A483CTP1_9EURY|nr:hypothetical protein [Methanofollis fontis]TAJ44763.1 hypothetical protein CUJ86_05560 [Methanofollis fontis]